MEAGAEHPACPQPRQAQPRALGAQRGVPTRKAQGAARHSPVFNYLPGHACFPAGGAAGRSPTPGRRPARRGPPAPLPSIPAAGRRAGPVGGLRGGAGADDPHAGQGESRLGRGLRRLKTAGAQSGRNCPDGLFTCARTGPRNLPARRHSFAHTHTHTNPFPAPARGQPGPGRAPASLTRKARPGPAAPPHSAARRAGGSPCARHCFGDSERLLMELVGGSWSGVCWFGWFSFPPCKEGLHQLRGGAETTTRASGRAGDSRRHLTASSAGCHCPQEHTDGEMGGEERDGTASVQCRLLGEKGQPSGLQHRFREATEP